MRADNRSDGAPESNEVMRSTDPRPPDSELAEGLLWALDQLLVYADWNSDSDAADRESELRRLAWTALTDGR